MKKIKRRLSPKERKRLILSAAVSLAETTGYHQITTDKVATKAQVSAGLVNHYFKSVMHLKAAILKRAIEVSNNTIILQGISVSDNLVKNIPADIKRKIIEDVL